MLKDFVHSPGPWRHRMIFEDDAWVEIVPADETIDIAQARCRYPEWRANAALIAAVPELLASLKELSDWMREHTGPKETLEILTRAHHVLAKAEGRKDEREKEAPV